VLVVLCSGLGVEGSFDALGSVGTPVADDGGAVGVLGVDAVVDVVELLVELLVVGDDVVADEVAD
jgi:hypothetical protein